MSFIKQKLEQKFSEVYNQLNEQQRKAVDTIEGPVMVIAGPGTGKTQILAARIGKILLQTDVYPENILCLTYTEAGVVAMRRRLQQFIGADAYKVNISTFHAFCNDVIQDNLSLFEKTSLNPISDLERIHLLRNLVDEFPQGHLLKRYRGNIYYEVNNLNRLFSNMKREGWSPQFINERLDAYLKELETSDEYIYKTSRAGKWNKGDRKPAYYDEIEKTEKLRAAVNEFNTYQQKMKNRNRYDFDDMINWVINAFEENKNLLAAYQEKYQYILVDEFQDTSGTQNRIIQLLIEYWEQPNIFVVGDDDQSIYRFQGANVENMDVFRKKFNEDLSVVVLTKNYRSTQPILNISKSLIENNNERLIGKIKGLTKDLMAANEKIKQLNHPPRILEYNNVNEEMAGITFAVEELVKNGTLPEKIAVIYRENKYGESLSQYLRMKKIPVFSKRSLNLLEEPFIKKLITILSYLNAEHDIPYGGDELLFEILHYDFYKIPAIEIAKLTVEVNRLKYSGEATSIRKLLNDKATAAPKDLFDNGIDPRLKNVSETLEELISDVSNMTIQQLLDNVIRKASLLNYVMNSEDKINLMQLLSGFFDFVKEENHRNPDMNLNDLISLIHLMRDEGLPLPMLRVTGSDKGVNLLTAHGSKGLEFEHVFLAGTNAGFWEKKRKPGGGYKIPSTVFSSDIKASDEEELRRLFYVAITRAEKYLYISYARFNNENKELEPSKFIAEIQDKHRLTAENPELTSGEMMDFYVLRFQNGSPVLENTEAGFIDNLLEKFVMNVTALNNYLSCPLKFYYQNLLRIPAGKNEATEFGSAIHFALERLFKKMKENGDVFPPAETMFEDFKWYIQRHRENFTKEAYARRMEQGAIIIPAYYKKNVEQWNKIVTVEMNINGVVINDVPIKGKIDKLEFERNGVNVVDYKTGNSEKAKAKLKPPQEKDPNGGDYWRQAVFYKLLIDNYKLKNWKVISTEFDFIEPDTKNNFEKQKVFISDADITTVTQQLTNTWLKIRSRDFYTGCGKSECYWCNFVKDNKLYTTLRHDEPEEE